MKDGQVAGPERPERYPEIERVCRAHGFALREARLENEVLRLWPASLEELPDAAALGQMAVELAALGFRYVTLAVDPAA